ncbi:MAG: hypothetical protein ACO3UN_06885 [Candidatus Puniceispirillaceae bacterium]
MKFIGFGEMHLTEVEFQEASPHYFMHRLLGMRKAQRQMERIQWERTRWLATFVVMPHSKRKLRPQDLMQFPWEKAERPNLVEFIKANKNTFDKLTPP